MNAVSLILRVLAIVGAIGAGAVYFLTQGKVANLTEELAAQSQQSATQLSSAQSDLKTAQDSLDKANADNKALTDQLKKATDDLASETDLRNQASAAADSESTIATNATAALADKQSQIDDLTQKLSAATAGAQDDATVKQQLQDLQDKYNAAIANITSNSTTAPSSSNGTVASGPTIPARVLQVDRKSGVLALNAGTLAGLSANSNVILQEGGYQVALVNLSEAEASYSVGTILSTGNLSVSDFYKTVAPGTNVDVLKTK
jgi:uncharacterized phage infection (PIP) family protein YhgE